MNNRSKEKIFLIPAILNCISSKFQKPSGLELISIIAKNVTLGLQETTDVNRLVSLYA